MNNEKQSRRSFLRDSAVAGAGASAFTIIKPELVRGAGKERLRAGLIGAGGRGTQASVNLLSGDPAVELVAVADLMPDRLEQCLTQLRNPKYLQSNVGRVAKVTGQSVVDLVGSISQRVKVDGDHAFSGFDAYKRVLASDVDVVLLCAPPGYRPLHLEAAVEAGKHLFVEKPFGTDAVGVRRSMAAVRKSEERKLTLVSGAQRRFQKEYRETIEKIQGGAIGDILAAYAYWIGSPVLQFLGAGWPGPKGKRDPKWSDMVFQNRSWYSFLWICGDQIVEQHMHNIDVCNWVMGTHPERVVASGGAAWRPREEEYGNIYDHLVADFVYPNGVHMLSHCRQYPSGSYENVSELIVGSKGRSNCTNLGVPGMDPYVQEHIEMCRSIRGDGPYINHGTAVAQSTMTCIMGREAAYSGREITWDMVMNSKQDLFPKNLDINASLETPPLPVPGQYKFV
ncbi:MAG: Gfo/Idh/MocA family oxidoreductase [Bryobacterales bacterium]|nr:Gfo/Idh/MocA family oxidoreductase [Bryobacterales bacterium]